MGYKREDYKKAFEDAEAILIQYSEKGANLFDRDATDEKGSAALAKKVKDLTRAAHLMTGEHRG